MGNHLRCHWGQASAARQLTETDLLPRGFLKALDLHDRVLAERVPAPCRSRAERRAPLEEMSLSKEMGP